VLGGAGADRPGDLTRGLRTTGHFLERRLAEALGDRPLPVARARFAALMARSDGAETDI
jgi:DNA repair protein RecO (recombination protein O)